MKEAEGRHALLRQEAIVAVVVNALLSIGFFYLVFGWQTVPARDFAIDFLPQSGGITFLGTLVPSLITYGRINRGTVTPAGPPPPIARHVLRIAIAALFTVVVFGGAAALLTLWLAPAELEPLPAVILKAVFGAVLGIVTTPPIIRAVLGMPMFSRIGATVARVA